MKHLLIVCLLAATGNLFAQNISIDDLECILYTKNTDSVDQFLAEKGFTAEARPLTANSTRDMRWKFQSRGSSLDGPITTITKWDDGTGVQFKTINASFYSNLLNQMNENGYSYSKTTTDQNIAKINFSNGSEDLLTSVLTGAEYELTLKPASGGTKLMNRRRTTKRTNPVSTKIKLQP